MLTAFFWLGDLCMFGVSSVIQAWTNCGQAFAFTFLAVHMSSCSIYNFNLRSICVLLRILLTFKPIRRGLLACLPATLLFLTDCFLVFSGEGAFLPE